MFNTIAHDHTNRSAAENIRNTFAVSDHGSNNSTSGIPRNTIATTNNYYIDGLLLVCHSISHYYTCNDMTLVQFHSTWAGHTRSVVCYVTVRLQ